MIKKILLIITLCSSTAYTGELRHEEPMPRPMPRPAPVRPNHPRMVLPEPEPLPHEEPRLDGEHLQETKRMPEPHPKPEDKPKPIERPHRNPYPEADNTPPDESDPPLAWPEDNAGKEFMSGDLPIPDPVPMPKDLFPDDDSNSMP